MPDEAPAKLRESRQIKSICASLFHRFDELRMQFGRDTLIRIQR